jgi:tRNA(Ile)-lysidine synthase
MPPLQDILRRVLADHDPSLLPPCSRVLVAVSGGPDSLSLIHALHALADELQIEALQVAHLDHGLRGAESAAEAAFVEQFCRERSIPCHVGYADVAEVARARKVGKQQAARSVRYRFLEATAEQVGADSIATAHTQDDQIETVLLNILRGTGLEGLRGIPTRRGLFIRPLLTVSHAELIAYCEAQRLTPRLDPSNLQPCCTRNHLRLELLPQLERDYNPGVREALLRLAAISARDSDYLSGQAEAALREVTLSATAPGLANSEQTALDAAKLRALHPSLLRHTLRAALRAVRGTLDGVTHEHIEPVCDAVCGGRRLPFGLTTPPPHCAIRVTQRRLTLSLRRE